MRRISCVNYLIAISEESPELISLSICRSMQNDSNKFHQAVTLQYHNIKLQSLCERTKEFNNLLLLLTIE